MRKRLTYIKVKMAECAEAELSLEYLCDVQEELYVARAKWYKVGLRLKVPVDTLDCIRKEFDDAGDQLCEALKNWLKGVGVKASWRALVDALRTKSVGESQLANQIETKYCATTPQGVGEVLNSPHFTKLRSTLEPLHAIRCDEKKKESLVAETKKVAIEEFITASQSSGHSLDQVKECLHGLHTKEYLISETIYESAQQIADELYAAQTNVHNPSEPNIPEMPVNAKEPLFFKDTIYHSSICSLAVNASDAGTYQQFFKSNPMVPGHSFQEISISREKQNRYLIARQGESAFYFAFQSEPNLQQWPKRFNSFSEGIRAQSEEFPFRFIVELLNKQCRIVLTGFSFGGLLACTMAALVWDSSYISSHELKENLAVITFGQPHVTVPLLLKVAREQPELTSTIHSIYWEDDVMPRLTRFLNECCSSLTKSKKPGLHLKMADQMKMPFQDPVTSMLFKHLGKIQETCLPGTTQGVTTSTEPRTSKEGALSELKPLLKDISTSVSSVGTAKQLPLCTTAYLISCDPTSGLTWDKMREVQAALHSGFLQTHEIERLTPDSIQQHSMAVYCQKLFRGHLQKPPDYLIPPTPKHSPTDLNILQPSVAAIKLHYHGNELAVAVEGRNFWFCYRMSVGGHPKDVPAQNVSSTSIQFNILTKDSRITVEGEMVKVTLHSHFHSKPIKKPKEGVPIHQKEYAITSRQEQLAKLTPSKLIELAYLSALLEQHPYGKFRPNSHKVAVISEFLNQVVKLVPLESIAYAIAYGSPDEVAVQCAKALVSSQLELPVSELMIAGLKEATDRIGSGISPDIINAMSREAEMALGVHKVWYHKTVKWNTKQLQIKAAYQGRESVVTKDWEELGAHISPRLITEAELVHEFEGLHRNFVYRYEKAEKDGNVSVLSELSIEQLYPVGQKTTTEGELMLQCPLDILRNSKKQLTSLAKRVQAQTKSSAAVTTPTGSKSMSSLDNSAMLKAVNDIRQKVLAVCSALLGGFMEQQEIDIPLVKSRRDRSEAFTLHGAVSVGVWALSSLNYHDIQPILSRNHANQLLVKIEKYFQAVFSKRLMATPDDQYAAKLQFMVQGMTKTVTCNSQYISYSLERQLTEVCDKCKIDASIPLKQLVDHWGTLFKNNILSLVALSHRPLIARWLKWALMVHNLREEMANYTAVGVAGLVNSGKSKLVNSLFGIQIPFGTKEVKRTTVPLMYNLDEKVEGIDVVDFPGVDDMDESIPDLAELLITLVQIVIFVVDYRKVHTESAKKWLEKLQDSNVPTIVCLTFADKLYAEHMSDKREHPSKHFMEHEVDAELSMIKEKLGTSPSRTVKFFSFSQDNDSVLNDDEGRQRLRDVGIGTPPEVGKWLMEVFKNRFGQDDLADRLHSFVQKTSTC